MAEYITPSNSNASKNVPALSSDGIPKQDKVISGNAKLKEPTKAEKLKEDSKNALKSVMTNTVGPSIKDMILNAVWNGLSMIFFPDGSHRPGGYTSAGKVYYGASTYNNYGSYYNSGKPQVPKAHSPVDPVFKNPIVLSIQDANEVINHMRAIIEQYGFATWATLYDLCGMDTPNWQGTTKYGWTSVEYTTIATIHTADGQIAYEIRMPRSSPIDDSPF